MKNDAIYFEDLKTALALFPNAKDFKTKRILVTGASGLIGSSIVDFLCGTLEMSSVYVAGRDTAKLKDRFSSYNCTVLEYDATKAIDFDFDVDYVIHAASPANPKIYASNPVETMLANLLGVNNIARYVLDHGKGRLVFISSSEVYGKNDTAEPYKESDYGFVDILNSRSCYPSSKRAAETLLSSYEKEYGLDYVVVRPGHIYGPTASKSDNRVSSIFFYDCLCGKDIVLKSAGTQIRSYCYVVDCVTGILYAIVHGETGEAYNISNRGSICSIREFAECIAKVSSRRVVFENPSKIEAESFNPMDNSSLDATKMEKLGWHGIFDLVTGVEHTYFSIE